MNNFNEKVDPGVPTTRFTDKERDSGNCIDGKLLEAAKAFHANGAIILENILPENFITQLHNEYVNKYEKYFIDTLHDNALPVGNRRSMLQVEVDGAFNNPLLYCHPLVAGILQLLLGKTFIIGGFGSVISLPGAEAQHIHRDCPPLFEALDGKLVTPAFAITVAIPLIPLTRETGSTRIYPGSHRVTREDAAKLPYTDPELPPGSLVMWDFLTYHGGLANKSDKVRPIMYFSYTRPWFRDPNYSHLNPVKMSEENYQKVPEGLRPLFSWSRPPTPLMQQAHDPGEKCPCFSGKLFKDCHGRG